MVMLLPLGTFGTYVDTGSLNWSLPSWASSTMSADVMVLVFEAIRKWVSASGGVCTPSCVVPTTACKVPLRGAQHDHCPGNE